MNQTVRIPFDNRYIQVAETLFSRQSPTPVRQPALIRVNEALAQSLNIDPAQLHSAEGIAVLAGNAVPEGAEPIATVYAGHQFGSWNPQLGDGRAILLGEVVGRDALRYDIQLKGAGVTPYSRMGDGRSPLGPVLREYIVSEAMAALGVPTTRALAAVTTGETVVREELLPGAILTRVARSHIRVGTFQYFAARRDWESVRKLADHVIERHYPQIKNSQIRNPQVSHPDITDPDISAADNPYLALLSQVVERQTQLIAQWQSLGFIHGVMNTDNMLVSGETVDYGPCAFMESYHPATVFSSIDHGGRYAYANQPAIAHWNLAWLAQSLLPLIDSDEDIAVGKVRAVLDTFSDLYLEAYQSRMSDKIGLAAVSDAGNELVLDYLSLLAKQQVDFTLGFRVLTDLLDRDEPDRDSVAGLYPLPDAFGPWLKRWRDTLGIDNRSAADIDAIRQRMQGVNPVFIPRNHRVEEAIQAGHRGDFTPFHRLVELLASPFDYHPEQVAYALPATPEQRVTRTFCGT